jgi:hypothetical protein
MQNCEVAVRVDELIGDYLVFGQEAITSPWTEEVGSEDHQARSNAVITSFTVVVLMSELRRLDPQRADQVTDWIAGALDDGDRAQVLMSEWSRAFASGELFGADPEMPVDQQVRQALGLLAQYNRAYADELWHRLSDPSDPLDTTAVLYTVWQDLVPGGLPSGVASEDVRSRAAEGVPHVDP